MPSPGAIERGTAAAEAILQQHRQEHDGAWPETVAVRLLCSCSAVPVCVSSGPALLDCLQVLAAWSGVAAMQQSITCSVLCRQVLPQKRAACMCTACSPGVPSATHHLQPAASESSPALHSSHQLKLWSPVPAVGRVADPHAHTPPPVSSFRGFTKSSTLILNPRVGSSRGSLYLLH